MTATKKLNLRERRKLQTREDLLDAAGVLFGEKGYAATSIDDIVARAGASRATLYAHFPGKDALLSAIVDRMAHEGLEFYEQFGALEDWSRKSILGWVRIFVAAWERDAARNRAASAADPRIFLEDAPAWHRDQVEAVRRNRELWSHFPEAEAGVRASMMVHVVQAELAEYFFNESTEAELDTDVFVGYLADAIRVLLEA
ncbi:TetR/AcrR family transcriptional regulator [Rhodococcus koreensis]